MRDAEEGTIRSARRMSTRTSLAAMVLAIVALACSAEETDTSRPRGSPEAAPASGTVPEQLADGSPLPGLPSAVRSAFDRPAVGAVTVGSGHSLVETCVAYERKAASPGPFDGTLAGAYLSPFGGGVQFETRTSSADGGSDRAMRSCDVLWRSGEPRPRTGALHPWPADDTLRDAGGALSYTVLEDREGVVAFVSVPVPEDTAWLVHDRGAHLVAYPVADGLPVRVSTPTRSTEDTLTISVVYLGAGGERVGADEVVGVVAG